MNPSAQTDQNRGAGDHLVLEGLVKSYGDRRVVDDISLTVHRGTTTAIIGPSGSGKTTLLRMIAGFERPDAGRILLSGQELCAPGKHQPAHQRPVGYVSQEGSLFPHLSVGQNVAFGLPGGQKVTADRVAELLETVSLNPDYAKRRPHQLSGGQQQRVALARALAREPELMLLDEPFSALDAGLRLATRRAVAQILAEAGMTTVLVTHDQAEALSFADQVAVFGEGTLRQVGSPFVVYNRPADRGTAEFLGEAIFLEADLIDGVAHCALGEVPVSPRALPRGERELPQGRVTIMLRPEQIRIQDSSPVRGIVLDSEYFGPETTIHLQLQPATPLEGSRASATPTSTVPRAAGDVITMRLWGSTGVKSGTELGLHVVGHAVVL
ncbi:ABC transporter ATP-binding protein [Psychromicrobium xiongbiense]|uniref:ABC transporter ATP-binding protein n=1 Tax=Psychromicrobium xiongbiense TaxID=3051184 RepID=UPI0025558E7D|nr:ABC transporter ATP-binding protein [Psychromicrobium sp. YIM S02556]